jgi:uncharacterized protein YnzC (UPF0291/DUF896 family)
MLLIKTEKHPQKELSKEYWAKFKQALKKEIYDSDMKV